MAEGLFVVEGEQLLREAVGAGWSVHSVFIAADARDVEGFEDAFRLGDSVMERVASTETPQPVLAVIERRTVALASAANWIVVVDRVTDPGNLGTIMRSAEAAGASQVVLTAGTVDAFNPKVVRASAGALFHVGIVEGVDLVEVRQRGYRLIGTTSHDDQSATDYQRADLRGPVAVVLGNEAHGLDNAAPVDQWVTIPHFGRSESLNVAMAGTILCFAVATQHNPPIAGE